VKFPVKRWPKLLFAQVYTRNTWTHAAIARLPRKRLDRPIFIVGVPRSGTSIYTTLFGHNRFLAHWSEAQAAWDPHWTRTGVSHRWTEERATPKEIRRIDNNFAYFTHWKKCERFLNKCPRNALRIPFLLACWPDAKIIYIECDPRPVVNSLVNETRRDAFRQADPLGRFASPDDWRELAKIENDVERFCRMVLSIHGTLSDDLDRCVPAEQLYRVSYEEFGTDCRASIRAACDFCEIKADEQSLTSFVPEKLENRNYKWLKQRAEVEVTTIREHLDELAAELGYVDQLD